MTKENLLRLGKYIGIYLVALSVSVFIGVLPFMALVSGLPIVLAKRQMGRRAAQVVALVSLVSTWFLLDELLFVYVGLGLMVGYSLAMVPAQVPFRFRFLQTSVGGFIWALVMHLVVKVTTGEGLLTLINTQFQQALTTTVENMQTLNLYTAEQIAEFREYAGVMINTLQSEWAFILFVYLLISIILTHSLARMFSAVKSPAEDLAAEKAPIFLAIATAVLAGMHYLLPGVATSLVTNLFGITSLLMSLFGFMLLLFYLRWLRVGPILRIFLGLYLLSSPIAWRILLLVGLFDACFDYRYYARNRQQG